MKYEIVNPGDHAFWETLFMVSVSDSGFGEVRFLVWAEHEDDFDSVEEVIVNYLVDNRRYINEYVWEPKAALEAMGVEETEENYEKMVDGQFDDFRMAGSGDWFIDSHQWSFAIEDDDSELYSAALEASEAESDELDIEFSVTFEDGRVAGVARAGTKTAAIKAVAKAYGLKVADLVAEPMPLVIEVED